MSLKDAHIMRLFVGGPWHNQTRAVIETSRGVSLPLPKSQRADLDVPEWFAYQLRGDRMVFTGRADDCVAALFISEGEFR